MSEDRYIKYFNYGYALSKHDPKVLERLLDATKNVALVHEPLIAGQAQYQKEVLSEKLNTFKGIHPDIISKRNKDIGLEL